jgi:glutaredoxin 3
MSPENLPVLYVKTGCPGCRAVIDFLGNQGVSYRERNLASDPEALSEMQHKSGQTKAPTLDWYGTVLAGFGVEELKEFLMERHVRLEDS